MYIAGHLRLGCIAKDFNEIQEAFDCFTETIRFDYNNFSAWTYLGELNTGKAQWEDAEKKFNLLLCVSKIKLASLTFEKKNNNYYYCVFFLHY